MFASVMALYTMQDMHEIYGKSLKCAVVRKISRRNKTRLNKSFMCIFTLRWSYAKALAFCVIDDLCTTLTGLAQGRFWALCYAPIPSIDAKNSGNHLISCIFYNAGNFFWVADGLSISCNIIEV